MEKVTYGHAENGTNNKERLEFRLSVSGLRFKQPPQKKKEAAFSFDLTERTHISRLKDSVVYKVNISSQDSMVSSIFHESSRLDSKFLMTHRITIEHFAISRRGAELEEHVDEHKQQRWRVVLREVFRRSRPLVENSDTQVT
jgi:hypothetical protein